MCTCSGTLRVRCSCQKCLRIYWKCMCLGIIRLDKWDSDYTTWVVWVVWYSLQSPIRCRFRFRRIWIWIWLENNTQPCFVGSHFKYSWFAAADMFWWKQNAQTSFSDNITRECSQLIQLDTEWVLKMLACNVFNLLKAKIFDFSLQYLLSSIKLLCFHGYVLALAALV